MPEFPHLPLPKKAHGSFNFSTGGSTKKKSDITLENLKNRKVHSKTLTANANTILSLWDQESKEVSKLPQPGTIPIFLHIDKELFDVESLSAFGVEVISEEDEGFIIGASSDYFRSLKEKIYAFSKNKGIYKTKAAQLWDIISGTKWRLDYIISEELNNKWDQIHDEQIIIVDVSIACLVKLPLEPNRYKNEREKKFEFRYQQWQTEVRRLQEQRERLEMKRQGDFDKYISEIQGERISDFVGFEDSFCCRLRLKGRALKEMVLYYQYLFNVTEYDDLTYVDIETGQEIIADVTILPPNDQDPTVCVIDSGIQEEHKLIECVIKKNKSKSYLANAKDISDNVPNGGHGTKVTGATIFGREIPKEGTYQTEVWIENAKILNNDGIMPDYLFPPELMEKIVTDFNTTRLFNLSVNAFRSCKIRHMSEWAGTLDKLMFENDILFVVSAGNINRTNAAVNNPGIQEYINNNQPYPDYLLENSCRIANPAQSCFAITVGSVCIGEFEDLDRISFGKKDQVSSFSRSGLGLWGMIKPDLVEYGGDYIREKAGAMLVSENFSVGSEVIRATLDGNNAIGHHVGTSYSAPKVSHIAAKIYKQVDNVSALMIRTLLVQSARLPQDSFHQPTIQDIRKLGYGIPDLLRATQNYEKRVTLTGEDKISPKTAHIYTLNIPEELRSPGNEFDVLIEVTMAFVASPRMTRQKTKSYLSSWLDWRSSRFGESSESFQRRMIKYLDSEPNEKDDEEKNAIQWKIRESNNWGKIKGCKRQDSSIQKDWVTIPAYNLPTQFSIAIIAHQGWNKDIAQEIPYTVAVSFEALSAEIPLNLYSAIEAINKIETKFEIKI
jgi:Subtilisin-like serine proteases